MHIGFGKTNSTLNGAKGLAKDYDAINGTYTVELSHEVQIRHN